MRADGVEILAGEGAVPELVVAPGEEERFGVGKLGLCLAEPGEVFVTVPGRLDGPAGQLPVLDGDHLDRQAERSQKRVEVLLDQAGHEYLAGEPLVEGDGAVGEGLLHLFERADGQDPVAGHGDCRGRRVGGLHGQDLPRRVDAGGGVGRRRREQDVQVALGLCGAGAETHDDQSENRGQPRSQVHDGLHSTRDQVDDFSC